MGEGGRSDEQRPSNLREEVHPGDLREGRQVVGRQEGDLPFVEGPKTGEARPVAERQVGAHTGLAAAAEVLVGEATGLVNRTLVVPVAARHN